MHGISTTMPGASLGVAQFASARYGMSRDPLRQRRRSPRFVTLAGYGTEWVAAPLSSNCVSAQADVARQPIGARMPSPQPSGKVAVIKVVENHYLETDGSTTDRFEDVDLRQIR